MYSKYCVSHVPYNVYFLINPHLALKSNSKIKMLNFTVRHSVISEQIKTNEVLMIN